MTIIDRSWGNPSAELIGYLYNYPDLVTALDVGSLVDYAIDLLLVKQEFYSEHELFCYIRFFSAVPPGKAERMKAKLREAVQSLVHTDPADFSEHVPQPVDFAESPRLAHIFGLDDNGVEANLDYLVTKIKKDWGIRAVWEYGEYAEEMDKVLPEWAGVLTLKALTVLRNYNRVETLLLNTGVQRRNPGICGDTPVRSHFNYGSLFVILSPLVGQ